MEKNKDKKIGTKEWKKGYVLLKEFKNRRNRFPKQKETYRDFNIGLWCHNQRSRKNKLNKKQIKLLNRLIFPWSIKYNWTDGFEEYKKYIKIQKEINNFDGQLKILRRYKTEDGFNLGKWVDNQNTLKRNNKLTDEQVKKLNDIGFHWNSQKRKKEEMINTNNDENQNISDHNCKKRNKKETIKIDKEQVFQSLKCMICLEMQSNAVTITICGHSYCSYCILLYCWNQIQHEPYLDYLYCGMEFKCPECKNIFNPKKDLSPNYTIRRIVDTLEHNNINVNNDDKKIINNEEQELKKNLFYRLDRIQGGSQWCAYLDAVQEWKKQPSRNFEHILNSKYVFFSVLIDTNKKIIQQNNSYKIYDLII